MGSIFQDLLYSLRTLRRARSFSYIAVSTLAVGIAANIIVFSVVNAVILRPLPYVNPARLTVLGWQVHGGTLLQDISAPAFFILQERARCFQSIAAIRELEVGVNLATAGAPKYVKALRVSADFFPTLGVAPGQGRRFRYEEDRYGGEHVAILSYVLWKDSFGKSSTVLGRDLRINGEPYKVIGVMPEEFRSYPEADLWLPLQLSPTTADPGNEYRVIARLKDGLTEEDAQRELDANEEYRRAFPVRGVTSEVRLIIKQLQSAMVAKVHNGLVLIFGAVIFVLLITCTNLAVLLTVKASVRAQETAIRIALGASRARLLQLALLESLWIALIGGLVGMALAKEMIPLILWLIPADLPRRSSISIDHNVVLFAVFTCFLTSLIFGLGPALKISRTNLNEVLKQFSNNATAGLQQTRTGRALVTVQAGLTLIFLIGAVSILRSFYMLYATPPGFDSEHVWIAQVSLAAAHYSSSSETVHLIQKIRDEVQNDPRVDSVASVTGLPLEKGLNLFVRPSDGPNKGIQVEYRVVSGDYFQALHIPMLAGRSFSDADHPESAPTAIVNATLARLWWPKQNAVGHHTAVSSTLGGMFSDAPREIVGVSADVHEASLAQPPPPTIFIPITQTPDGICAFINKLFMTSFIVRTRSQTNLSESFPIMLSSADPDLSLASFRPLSQIVSDSLARPRFYASVVTAFGAFALLLTAVGLYGLLSYQLLLRSREIGVRMAVGARRSEVIGLVVRQGIQPVVIGVVLGIAGTPIVKKLLGAMLYNLSGTTISVLGSAVLLLGMVALLTGLLTAVRATAIEPMVVLRTE